MPPRYTTWPAKWAAGEAANCVVVAVRRIEGLLGGALGRSAEGLSIADLEKGGGQVLNEGSQEMLIRFLNDRRAGRAEPTPLPEAAGPGVASRMPGLARAGVWTSRALMAAAPVIEAIMNYREGIPWMQNVARSGAVTTGVLAMPGLYGPTSGAFGLKGGSGGASTPARAPENIALDALGLDLGLRPWFLVPRICKPM